MTSLPDSLQEFKLGLCKSLTSHVYVRLFKTAQFSSGATASSHATMGNQMPGMHNNMFGETQMWQQQQQFMMIQQQAQMSHMMQMQVSLSSYFERTVSTTSSSFHSKSAFAFHGPYCIFPLFCRQHHRAMMQDNYQNESSNYGVSFFKILLLYRKKISVLSDPSFHQIFLAFVC